MTDDRSAALCHMVLRDRVCPFRVRAKELLEQAGLTIEDNLLRSCEEVDRFKADQGVETTAQIFIDGAHLRQRRRTTGLAEKG